MAKRRHWSSFQNSNFKFALASSHTLATHFSVENDDNKVTRHPPLSAPLPSFENKRTHLLSVWPLYAPALTEPKLMKVKVKGKVDKHIHFQFPFFKHLHFVLQLAMGPL